MLKKIVLTVLLVIIVGGVSAWYYYFPAYEKKAEDRITKYMEAQGVDKSKVIEKRSMKDMKIGRWQIRYKFEDERHLYYRYAYDRPLDEVLLTVYHSPNRMDGGKTIDRGMNYPRLEEGWTKFDKDGEIQLE